MLRIKLAIRQVQDKTSMQPRRSQNSLFWYLWVSPQIRPCNLCRSIKNNLKSVLLQQKRAIRCLAELNYRDSCQESFKELKIPTAFSIYIRETIIYTSVKTQPRHGDLHNAAYFSLTQHQLSLFQQIPAYKGALDQQSAREPQERPSKKRNSWHHGFWIYHSTRRNS